MTRQPKLSEAEALAELEKDDPGITAEYALHAAAREGKLVPVQGKFLEVRDPQVQALFTSMGVPVTRNFVAKRDLVAARGSECWDNFVEAFLTHYDSQHPRV